MREGSLVQVAATRHRGGLPRDGIVERWMAGGLEESERALSVGAGPYGDGRRWLTIRRCAEVLGITEEAVVKLAKRGALRSRNEDGELVVEAASISRRSVGVSDQT